MKFIFFLLIFFGVLLKMYAQDNSSKTVIVPQGELKNFKFTEQPTRVVITNNSSQNRGFSTNETLQKRQNSSNKKRGTQAVKFSDANLSRVKNEK